LAVKSSASKNPHESEVYPATLIDGERIG